MNVVATNPTVSVVLPTYNRATVLVDSIRSVLEQTYTDFELLVVDDASTDDTESVIQTFDDPRIRYIEHETNKGVSAARNTGIAQSRGDIVAFQDSDDEWLPEKLRKQMAVFDESPADVGVVYTGMYRTIDGNERYLPYPSVEHKEGTVAPSLVRQNFISTQMAAVRRDCFDDVGGFDEEIAALVDWELWLRLSEHYRFKLVDEPLVSGAVLADSVSTNRRNIVHAREHVVEKHSDRFDDSALATHLFFVGHGALKLGDTAKGRQYLRAALRVDPSLQYAVAAVLSHLGKPAYAATYRSIKWLRSRAGGHL